MEDHTSTGKCLNDKLPDSPLPWFFVSGLTLIALVSAMSVFPDPLTLIREENYRSLAGYSALNLAGWASFTKCMYNGIGTFYNRKL